ncbi:MAG: CapA family protein [Holophagaceae bacterium]|nr:CapA family protein [Holophagaceae bacterium]
MLKLKVACIFLLLAVACERKQALAKPDPDAARLPKVISQVRLVAVGDIMMHNDVKKAAMQSPDQQEEGFPSLWADVIPLLKDADIAFGNLETPVAPRSGKPGVPFQFNSPEGLPKALKASGFTVLSTANNHAYDQGVEGVAETLERLKEAGLVAVGSGESQAVAERPQIIEKNGIKFAFLAFTDLFNIDLNRKATEPWVRPLNLEPAKEAIRAIRSQANVVVVSLHWGNEYQHEPTQRQRDIAKVMVEAGADLILASHPHVLQPIEQLEAGGRKAIVAYSLGNFIANQDRFYRADLFPVAGGDNRDGAAIRITFSKELDLDGRETVRLRKASYEPLWTENNAREMIAGKDTRREVHVLRVNAALESARKEVDRLGNPNASNGTADEQARRIALIEAQERFRTLLLRKQRIAAIVGQSFEDR